MSERAPLTEEDRDALIANLDGELDEETSRKVETRISQDPGVRAELESLRRTWELLDYLPRSEPSPNFTNRTLDRITAQRDAAAAVRRRRRRWAIGLGWAAGVAVAAAAGFALVALLPREPSDED